MKLLEGKKGVIMGIANDYSIAWAITKLAKEHGAEIAVNHLPDTNERKRNEKRVRKLTESIGIDTILPCDVQSDEQIDTFFGAVKEKFGKIDFFVHSIAFGTVDDIKGPTINCSREGFKLAMDISCYSYLATAKRAAELMGEDGGSMLAMSYYGGEKVIPGYNMMGICKSALEMAVQYAAYDLGEKNIRSNAISAGPIRTLAASAVGDFREMMNLYENISPMNRGVTADEVAKTALYYLSDMSRSVTGEITHVDAGYNIMGGAGHALKKMKEEIAQA